MRPTWLISIHRVCKLAEFSPADNNNNKENDQKYIYISKKSRRKKKKKNVVLSLTAPSLYSQQWCTRFSLSLSFDEMAKNELESRPAQLSFWFLLISLLFSSLASSIRERWRVAAFREIIIIIIGKRENSGWWNDTLNWFMISHASLQTHNARWCSAAPLRRRRIQKGGFFFQTQCENKKPRVKSISKGVSAPGGARRGRFLCCERQMTTGANYTTTEPSFGPHGWK